LFAGEGNWNEAIAELEQAFVIAPYESALAFELGQAYARRFGERRDPADKTRAEQLLRRCLAIDPAHARAVAELSRLDRPPRRRFTKGIALVTGGLVCFALGLLAARGRFNDGDTLAGPVVPSDVTSKPGPDGKTEL